MKVYKFAEIIEEVKEYNNDLKYGLNNIVGVTIEKGLIPTIANLSQTALDKFYIVQPKTFVYNPRTHGVRIGMGYNQTKKTFITSWNNLAFRVKKSALEVLNPDYLWLYFNRSEWDRETNFRAWGSSTIVFSWNIFMDMTIELPAKSIQDIIVKQYSIINERILLKRKINDNLEATAQAYFDSLFFPPVEPDCTLADIAEVNPVRQLKKGDKARCFDMSTLPTNGCIPAGDEIKPYNGGVRFINGDTLIARITPCLENGKAAYINLLQDGEVAFGSTEYIVFAPKDEMPSSFYYFLIRNSQFVTFALRFMNGSSGRQRVSGEELASFPLSRPSLENLIAFDKVGSMVLEQMKEIADEIQMLKQLQEIITATLSIH